MRTAIVPLLAALLLPASPAARAADAARAPGTSFTDCDGCPEMIVVGAAQLPLMHASTEPPPLRVA